MTASPAAPGTPGAAGDGHDQAARHDPVYDELHATAEFRELRSRYRGFVLPATAAFLVWYLLYVVLSNWAPGLMGTQVVGNINVALIFGLLQFATTFAIAYVYSRFSGSRLDPLARELDDRYTTRAGATGTHGTHGQEL